MRRLDTLLSALERDRPNALVTLREAAVHERDGELVLPGRSFEAAPAQPVLELVDGRTEPLVDRLVVALAAAVRAIDLFAVEQRDDRVVDLHARHFARARHVADRELVLAVRREIVRDDEPAAGAE